MTGGWLSRIAIVIFLALLLMETRAARIDFLAVEMAKAAHGCAPRTEKKPPGIRARGEGQEVPGGALAFQGAASGGRSSGSASGGPEDSRGGLGSDG